MSGIPAWAVPGARVVCVDSTSRDGRWVSGEEIYEGRRYTIARAFVDFNGYPACELREVVRAGLTRAFYGTDNVGYNIYRFRPLVEDSDELGIETQLYRAKGRKSKAPVRESADA